MWSSTPNLGPIGLAVLTFIRYKQTNTQTDKQTFKPNLYIDREFLDLTLSTTVCPTANILFIITSKVRSFVLGINQLFFILQRSISRGRHNLQGQLLLSDQALILKFNRAHIEYRDQAFKINNIHTKSSELLNLILSCSAGFSFSFVLI